MHPTKYTREAIKYAEENGWTFTKSRGHAYGRIHCRYGHGDCQMSIWSTLDTPKRTQGGFGKKLMPVLQEHSMTPEFYLILRDPELEDTLADAVYEAGFDDSSFVMRSGRAAIWVTDREGDLTELVREALEQASQGGLDVLHVEITREAFAKAQ